MKVIYYSSLCFADCDFPLVREMHKKGIKFKYYLLLPYGFQKSNLLEFDSPLKKWGVYKASHIKEMDNYRDCADLNQVFLICGYTKWWSPLSWLLWLWAYLHMAMQCADIFHYTWQFKGLEKILYMLPVKGKKIMTVHDPIQHSGLAAEKKNEIERKRCFKWTDYFILLSSEKLDVFSNTYGIAKDRIKVSHLGAYDSIAYLNIPSITINKPYIIFFGTITPHKGLEYLVQAMHLVHDRFPEVELLIAGAGKIYFDDLLYNGYDYIKIENRYVGIRELVNLIKNALFTICPYKDATQSGVVQTSFTLNVPVVATSTGSLPKVVIDGVYGRIVPPCSVDSLSEVICELLEDPDMIRVMKNNIYEKWMSSMTWDSIVDDYVALYKSNIL